MFAIYCDSAKKYWHRTMEGGWNSWSGIKTATLFTTQKQAEFRRDLLVKSGAERYFHGPIRVVAATTNYDVIFKKEEKQTLVLWTTEVGREWATENLLPMLESCDYDEYLAMCLPPTKGEIVLKKIRESDLVLKESD